MSISPVKIAKYTTFCDVMCSEEGVPTPSSDITMMTWLEGFLFHEEHSYCMLFAPEPNRYVRFVALTPEQLGALLTWGKKASPLDT
jgi:hypothetical protein